MGEDTLQDAAKELIDSINSYETISSAGLKDAMFPDDLINVIHNHLGNFNQFISSASEAFNGAEQTLAYRSAQNELGALSSSLFSAYQTELISEPIFRNLDEKIKNISKHIGDITGSGVF